MTRQHLVATFSALALITAAGMLTAGPINPPVGPVASTGKTTQEVFDKFAAVEPRIAINAANTPGDNDASPSLFKITTRGSYYLTGNITGVNGKYGIEIAASGVTVDLNGFDLVGVAGMGPFDGVGTTVSGLTNIAVVNGSVRNWGGSGVGLGDFSAFNCRVADVLASGNAGVGINTSNGSTISNCSALQNSGNGIATSSGSTITNCLTTFNSSGIATGPGCTVSNCSAHQNNAFGIAVASGSTVSNCSTDLNTSSGIGTDNGCTVSNCSAQSNTGTGISAGTGCTISNCSASTNTANGISTSSGCTIVDCTAHVNTLDGIVCNSACMIRGNHSSSNGSGSINGAGIRTTSFDNRVEGNNCTGADRGIVMLAAGNIIIRNTCSGNSINWEIAIGNSVGPIIVAGTNAAVISGNGPAASTLGSSDPHANFSY